MFSASDGIRVEFRKLIDSTFGPREVTWVSGILAIV
jgi:hypothetical protein